MDITKIDPNLATIAVSDEDDVQWISAHDERLTLYGVYYDKSEGRYRRMPATDAEKVSKAVAGLSTHTSGGRIRFVTDSKYIAIKAAIPTARPMTHMTMRGSMGFGVYADGFFENSYSPDAKAHIQDLANSTTKSYFATKNMLCHKISQGNDGKSVIDVYFPLYGGVLELYIGVARGSVVEKGPKYKYEKPMVFYGSSITQGGCVSHPGNDYTAIISRRLDADYINLGFSGNGNAEDAMVDYLNAIDASLYAFDYNMFAKYPDRVLPPHYSIYQRLREKHPDVPILLYDKPAYDYTSYPEREEIIRSTYERAVAEGDKLIAHVHARELFGDENRDICTVDASHPTDYGALKMADALTPVIKALFEKAYK